MHSAQDFLARRLTAMEQTQNQGIFVSAVAENTTESDAVEADELATACDAPCESTESQADTAPRVYCYEERLTCESIKNVAIGDVLEIRYFELPHKIIVENTSIVDTEQELIITIDAIHYGRDWLSVQVMREKFQFIARKDSLDPGGALSRKCWKCHFPPTWCHPPDVVVQRARSRLNEREHSVIDNRASHFAFWCKTQSVSNRANNIVPIFVAANQHIHEVKVGDHLNFATDGEIELHGEVRDAVKASESQVLLTMLVSSRHVNREIINSAHICETRIQKPVQVVKSAAIGLTSEDLQWRIRMIQDISYKRLVGKLAFCLHLTNPNLSREDWLCRAIQVPNVTKETAQPLCKTIRPELLNPGDIILHDGIYSVVSAVRCDGSGALITKIQYSARRVNKNAHNCLFEIKIAIEKYERQAVLCVHKDIFRDCHLYGGGLETPSYTVTKVTSVNEIYKGCVISTRDGLVFKHLVVTDCPKIISTPAMKNQVMFSAISYNVGPSMLLGKNSVAESSYTINLRTTPVYVMKYCVSNEVLYSTEEVVLRARSRLGERQHNFQWNSGRDLARWCSIKHQSNLEQGIVPVTSADDLHRFQRGHIKFLKKPKSLYAHNVLLKECSKVEDCDDVLRVIYYENNVVFKHVRIEKLDIGEDEHLQRVRYASCREWNQAELENLIDHTFLNADDDRLGYLGMQGSRVTSQDFCFWIKTRFSKDGIKAVKNLLGEELGLLRNELKVKRKDTETIVGGRSLKPLDHIVLRRTVAGKEAEVHFVITSWDANLSTGYGVTYEFPVKKTEMGFYEFKGFLRLTGPGQIEKVVHNSEFNWDLIQEKIRDLRGGEDYSIPFNNCEHFVNYLIYGRVVCLQLVRHSRRLFGFVPSFLHHLAADGINFLKFAMHHASGLRKVGVKIPIFESVGLVLNLVIAGCRFLQLIRRRARTAMPHEEFSMRRRYIFVDAISSTFGVLLALVLIAVQATVFTPLTLCSALIGYALLKLIPLVKSIFVP
ncbi:hypothetical protein BOX15_Mlig027402g1 [Macrostomum lignano]|uniref:LRAT domain-containing protein n=1 Tax=Macrostomum lignano TaxID=282301 RepID=A0A267DF96_9PLAT|nr:hypothetical protein BOX15_Mlig027402g1 [Macrostomum lignano]